MSLFSNAAVNRVYLHSAIQAFAETGGGVFFLVLLIKAGLSVPAVLCALAAILLGRLALRAAVLPLARRFGLRTTLILGTLLESNTYWLTPHVEGLGVVLAAIIGIGSVGSVLYWTCYHAYVAATGSVDSRGAQVGAIEAINAIVAVVAPVIVTLLLVNAGPKAGYAVVAIVQMLAVVPLLRAPEVAIPDEADGGRAARHFGALLTLSEGFFLAFTHHLWLVALFVTLGAELGAYGGTMAAAGLAGAMMSLAMGRLIDLGHGARSALVAYGFAAMAASAKAAAFAEPLAAVAAAALAAIVASVQLPVMMTRLYALAKSSGCPLRFHMATEAGWDLGCASGCLIAAAMIASGSSIGVPIWLALPGCATVAALLYRSYANEERSMV